MKMRWLFIIILVAILTSPTSLAMVLHGMSIYDGKLHDSGHSWAGYGKVCNTRTFDLSFKMDRLEGGVQANINMVKNNRYAIGFINLGNGSLSVYLFKEHEDQTKEFLMEGLFPINPTEYSTPDAYYSRGVSAINPAPVAIAGSVPTLKTMSATPALSLSPSSGMEGDTVTVTGSSFNVIGIEFAQASIEFNGISVKNNVWFNGDSFTTSFMIPAGTPPGTYTVKAIGPKDSAEATFTVMGNANGILRPLKVVAVTANAAPALSLSPSSGMEGDTVTVTGSSFNVIGIEFAQASIEFNGISVKNNVWFNGDSFTTSFMIPAGTPPGTYTVKAIGPKDSAEATFAVTGTANTVNYPIPELLVRIGYDQGRIEVFISKPDQEFSRPVIDYIDNDPLPPGKIDFETLEGSSVHLSEVATTCSSQKEESANMGVGYFKEPDSSHLIDATSTSGDPFFVRWGEVPANQIMVVIDGTVAFSEARKLARQLAASLGEATNQEASVVGEFEYINLFQIETQSRKLSELFRDISFARNFSPLIVEVFPNEQIYPENSLLNKDLYSGTNGEGYRIIGVQEAWNSLDKFKAAQFSKVNVGIVDDGIYKGYGQFAKVNINTFIKIYPESPPCELSSASTEIIAGSHGTGIANIIAAETKETNGKQLQGIASYLPKDRLSIFMVNVAGKQTGKSFVTGSMLAFQCEIQNGSSIISCSMGKTNDIDIGASKMYDKFFSKLSKDPRFDKVLFIFSAGNEGQEIEGYDRIPNGLPDNKTLPNVITVGNILNDGSIAQGQTVFTDGIQWMASRSNKVSQDYPEYITLAAPGEQAVWGWNGLRFDNILGGTSMAAPQVTAAAVLIRSINPCLTAAQIKDILNETARTTVSKTQTPAPKELGGRILAIDSAVNMAINKRTTSSCAFESGDSIDLPGDYNKYDDIYGSTDTTNHGLYTTINIVSERYKGYTISVDGKQIGVEGQGGDVLDGRYTIQVAGNQQHLIRIDHPMNWAWWQYFYNAGDNITYDFDNAGNININNPPPIDTQPSFGGTYTPTGSDTTINIVSNQYRGYTVSVDGKQIGVEGQGGDVLDGRYTFQVAGNQQHLIRIDHPMNWKRWQYFYNAGDNITYDF